MTLLSIGRAFYGKPVLDTSTITDPWKGSLPDIPDYILRCICNRLGALPSDPVFEDFHFSTKTGPNGPAMATSPKDLASLPHSTIDDLTTIGGDLLGSYVEKCFMRTPIKGLSFIDI